MSLANVDCLRRAIELGNAGELEALAALYHPDIELRDLQHPPDSPETMHGRTALVASWQQWLEALGSWRVEVREYIDAHPWVVCDMRWSATGTGSEASVEWRDAGAFMFADGLIRRQILGFPDLAKALEEIWQLD